MRVVDDEGADLRRRPLALERRGHLQVGEPYDLALHLGDDDPVADDLEPLEASLDGARLRGIAELAQQARHCRRVPGLRVPDRQIHGARL